MPKSIPFKETMCKLALYGFKVPVKTPTDVLRIAKYMSTGKTDLIIPHKVIRANAWTTQRVANPEYENSKFKKFTRKERRYLLSLIDEVANISEMVLKRGQWLRLGEILHPGEYKKQYNNAFRAFYALRNKKVVSWYSSLEKGFKISLEQGIEVIKQRPGEFARRLDALLRNNPFHLQYILDEFTLVSNKVSNKVIFELIAHFQKRSTENVRKIKVGESRKFVTLPTLPIFHQQIVDKVVTHLFAILSDKFTQKESLGKVYIDEKLKNIVLPLSMKGVSFSTRPTVRGSKMPLEAGKKVLRAYVRWTAGVDLDLSVQLANTSNSKGFSTTCSYHKLRPCRGIQHSGDVIPRHVGKHAEYVDIELDKIPYEYAMLEVRNFAGGELKNVGAAFGFMEREFPEENLEWYPKTITSSYVLDGAGTNVCLALIDIKKREWMLIDEDKHGIPISFGNDIEGFIDQYAKLPDFSVYHLLELHAKARGEIATDKDIAEGAIDTEFKFEDFTTTYETAYKFMED
jgi:hypothetical protein